MLRPTNVSIPCDVVIDDTHLDLIRYGVPNATYYWDTWPRQGYLIYNNTLVSANTPGFNFTFTFEGTGVVVYGAQDSQAETLSGVTPNGLITLSTYDLDGVTSNFVSSPDVKYGVLYFHSGPLPFDSHTLTITVTQATEESPYLLDYIGYNTTSDVATPSALNQPSYIPTSAIAGCALIWVVTLLASASALVLFRRRLGHFDYHSILGRKEGEEDQLTVIEPFDVTSPPGEGPAMPLSYKGGDRKCPLGTAASACASGLVPSSAAPAASSSGGRTVPYSSMDEKAGLRSMSPVSETPK